MCYYWLLISLSTVAEFAFTSANYTFLENVTSAEVEVSLVNGTLNRSIVVTVTPSSFQAVGNLFKHLC